MYGMDESLKSKLIHLAGRLQSFVDEILECAKDCDPDKKEKDDDDKPSTAMKIAKLSESFKDLKD